MKEMPKKYRDLRPVALVIAFCKDNPEMSRNKLQKALEAFGVNPATARTQIQRFRKNNGEVTVRESNGPCAKVREICSKNPTANRKDQIAKAVAEGVNYATAATQVQKWRSENAKAIAEAEKKAEQARIDRLVKAELRKREQAAKGNGESKGQEVPASQPEAGALQ